MPSTPPVDPGRRQALAAMLEAMTPADRGVLLATNDCPLLADRKSVV